jgi:hypothetical protein
MTNALGTIHEQPYFDIHPRSPQAAGLLACWLFHNGVHSDHIPELSHGLSLKVRDNDQWQYEPTLGLFGLKVDTGLITPLRSHKLLQLQAPYTLHVVCKPLGVQTMSATIWAHEYSNPRGWPWVSYKFTSNLVGLGTHGFEASNVGGVLHQLNSSESGPDVRLRWLTATNTGSDLYFYVDGKLESLTQGVNTQHPYGNGRLLWGMNEHEAERFNGLIFETRIYRRAMAAWEVARLHSWSTRFALYQPIIRRRRVLLGAGSSSSSARLRHQHYIRVRRSN